MQDLAKIAMVPHKHTKTKKTRGKQIRTKRVRPRNTATSRRPSRHPVIVHQKKGYLSYQGSAQPDRDSCHNHRSHKGELVKNVRDWLVDTRSYNIRGDKLVFLL